MFDWYDPNIENEVVQNKFKLWLSTQGAEVLATTNPYELVRFFARNKTHIVYTGKKGVSSGKFAESCFKAFANKYHVKMGITKKDRGPGVKWRSALIDRDGQVCFFCLKLIEDKPTVEHLVAIGKGGPDHLDNMALAHEKCNTKANNLPLMDKIKIRDEAIYEQYQKEEKVKG